MGTDTMTYQRDNCGLLQITFREEVLTAFRWIRQSWGRAAQMTNCINVCWVEALSFCVRAVSRCASPYSAALQSTSVYPTQHSKACLERTGVWAPLWAYPSVPLCPCWYLFPVSRVPTASSYPLCLFLLGNSLCSSCLSRSQSFLSSSPIPLWETLHCTWPSFQSGATFTDVSSLCLIVPYLEWERACPIIVTTKPNQAHVCRLLWPPWGVWQEAWFFWWYSL